MGCDIHMFCEKRIEKRKTGEKVWVNADLFLLHHCDDGEPYHDNPHIPPSMRLEGLFDSRNYPMFAALAGVRDYSGSSPKIDEPRGLPDNVCDLVRSESESWDVDGHSHSYVTLREVRDFVRKNPPVVFEGELSPAQAKALKEDGVLPQSWCQWTSGESVRCRWEDDTVKPLHGLFEAMCERFLTWRDVDSVSDEELDNYRIVFWFDN